MKKILPLLTLAFVITLLVYVMPVAAQPPPLPANHCFRGDITIGGESAPDGTIVSAHIGSLSWSVTTTGGSYRFVIPLDDPAIPGKDGGKNGDEIIFKVDGELAATYTFQSSAFTELNLNISATEEIYYTLTINTLPSDSGTVALNPSMADNRYEHGTSVTLTAQPAGGYVFDHWSGDSGGSTNPLAITMDTDKLVIAHFRQVAPDQYSLEISGTEGGSVTTPGEGTFRYGAAEQVELVASPNDGYEFDEWAGDVDTVADTDDPTTTINMNDDKSIVAYFNEKDEISVEQYSLDISSAEGGSVTTPGEGTFHYDAAEQVQLVASPDDGYEFDEWTGDVDAVADIDDPTTTIKMNENKSVTALFTAVTPGISPARFTFSNLLIVPKEIKPDQQVEISIEAANHGGTTGERTVILYINGDLEDSRTVSVAPGSTQDVAFTLSKTTPGIYDVLMEGLPGQFIVAAPSTTSTADGFNTGIIVAIAAFVAVLVLAFLFIRRRGI